MGNYKRRRSALLNVIEGLQQTDFVSDEIVELDEIEETIPENFEEIESCDDLYADEAFLPEDDDDETIISEEDLEQYLSASQDDDQEEDDDQEDEEENEVEIEETETASEEKPGIEDMIQDTENGGDPTTSEIAPGGEEAKQEVQTDDEVFPTNSEYVAKLVRKFDRIANELENMGMTKLAFKLDSLSDKLEQSCK